jgi:hypothetical protein
VGAGKNRGGSDGTRTRGLRRDGPGDFSIKSTKVQNFDDAITGAKKPKSLNSANRMKRVGNRRSDPRGGRPRALLRTTFDQRNGSPKHCLPAWAGTQSQQSASTRDFYQVRNQTDDHFAFHRVPFILFDVVEPREETSFPGNGLNPAAGLRRAWIDPFLAVASAPNARRR